MNFIKENKIFVLSCVGAIIFFGMFIASMLLEVPEWMFSVSLTGIVVCVILEYLFKPVYERKE